MDKQLQKYRGMIAVEQEYAKSGMTDSEFAKHISTADVTYSTAMIRQWRQVLKLPTNTPLSQKEQQMLACIRAMWVQLDDLMQGTAQEELPVLHAQAKEYLP